MRSDRSQRLFWDMFQKQTASECSNHVLPLSDSRQLVVNHGIECCVHLWIVAHMFSQDSDPIASPMFHQPYHRLQLSFVNYFVFCSVPADAQVCVH